MARIEKKSIEEGADPRLYMDRAALAIFQHIQHLSLDTGRIALLIGRGNNGGDAYEVGRHLCDAGAEVIAFAQEGSLSELCQEKKEAFPGTIIPLTDLNLSGFDLIVDGLLGTGFQGEVKPPLDRAIEVANNSHIPIIAIDIPSGLNGDTGIGQNSLKAQETITLGAAKIGCFIEDGFEKVGKITVVDFGLDPKYYEDAELAAHLLDVSDLTLPPLKRTQHKYEAGYVLAVAGSPNMPGAAILSTLAALRSGAGIVRLFHVEGMDEALAAAPLELVRSHDLSQLVSEAKRASSLLIGPGLGRDEEAKGRFDAAFQTTQLPVVIDADGLFHLAERKFQATTPTILTPHKQEMLRLLGAETLDLNQCQAYADQTGATVILKGAPTWIFHPKTRPTISPYGDPGMATAGTGDVLTGIVAACLAKGLNALDAAKLAVSLHAIAGERAAETLTSEALIASDLIDFLPEAIDKIHKNR